MIDVCKAVEEMIKEGEERGELRMLVKLVKKGVSQSNRLSRMLR